ncbi:MAG: hypothetical protein LAO51_14720 [Acidobacteriia bacterium]|nr:hypothetical protein [Terriglobia bacterium]
MSFNATDRFVPSELFYAVRAGIARDPYWPGRAIWERDSREPDPGKWSRGFLVAQVVRSLLRQIGDVDRGSGGIRRRRDS